MFGVRVLLSVLLPISFLLLPPPSEGVGLELWSYHQRPVKGRAGAFSNWCYDEENPASNCKQDSDQSDWQKEPTCKSGERQSPVDITGTASLNVDFAACPIDFGLTPDDGYNLMEYDLKNYGYTIHLHAPNMGEYKTSNFRFPGRNDGTYTLVQLHFHWGKDDTVGSEHLIDGTSFPLEMHMVHYRSGGPNSYPNDAEALVDDGDALSVIGFMLQVDTTGTADFFDKLTVAMDKVPKIDATVNVIDAPLLLRDEIRKQTHAYHYEGSLTTPGCNEIVQWLMMKDPIKVKPEFIQKMRDVTGFDRTFREPQNLGKRTISKYQLFH